MKKFCVLLICCFLLATGSAFAARGKKRKPVAPPASDFSVKVPASEIDVASRLPRQEDTRDVDYELAISLWEPDHFSRRSTSTDVSDFGLGSTPQLSLSRVAPLASARSNGARFFWRAGLAYANLERSGITRLGAVPYRATQSLSLVSARLGVEYRALDLMGGLVQPYVNLALLPTYALGSASPLEPRVSAWGFPFEAGAGFIFRPNFLEDLFGLGDASLGAGAHYIFGSIDGSKLDGLGAQAFVQITL